MKAIGLEAFGIENLRRVDVPTPDVGENEVLVRVKAAALQYLDVAVVEGTILPALPLPHIPVSEGAGVIEAVGARVTRWQVGERVLIPFIQRWEAGSITSYSNEIRTGLQTPGTLAEYMTLPESTLVRSPSTLSDEEAATLPVAGLTAWTQLVNEAQAVAGQTLLTQGTGGVSLFALQIAKALGLKVIATTSSPEKPEKLRGLGADETLNYQEVNAWGAEARRLNSGVGVDITLDVGGAENIGQSVAACRENAYIGLVGFMSGARITVDLLPLIMNYLRLQGYSVGSAEDLASFVSAVERTGLKPVIDTVFELGAVQEAFRRTKSPTLFGKVVVRL